MIAEKTIKICGREVQMRYCAAAETGYERLSGQSSDIFVPDVEKDEEGNIKSVTQKAKADDYIKLAIAAIIAAYAKDGEDTPVTTNQILFDAKADEVQELISSVIELRAKWYDMPEVITTENEETSEEEGEKPKNA